MKASATLVLGARAREAGVAGASEALAQLGDSLPTLAVLFASPHYSADAAELAGAVHKVTGPVPMVSCVAQSVIGSPFTVTGAPAPSWWAMTLSWEKRCSSM